MNPTWQRRVIRAVRQPSAQLLLAGVEAPPTMVDALFFALRPTPAAVAQIAGVAKRLRERAKPRLHLIAPTRLHVSLCGLGRYLSAPDPIVRCACAAAARTSATPFTLAFDRVETFGRGDGSRPLVLTASDGAVRLHELRERLGVEVAAAGLPHSAGRAYVPHLTLGYVREVIPGMAIAPVTWTVDEIVLIQSMQGRGRHIVAGRWYLAEG